MKKLLYALCALTLLATACKKKDTPIKPDPGPLNPFYCSFLINGTESHNFTSSDISYPTLYAYQAGGEVLGDTTGGEVTLKFTWPVNDTVHDKDVLALAGKTFKFDDTITGAISAELTYIKPGTTDIWYSQTSTDGAVTITSVVFARKDTSFGTPMRRYQVSGTCKASLFHYPNTIALSNCGFTMAIGIVDL